MQTQELVTIRAAVERTGVPLRVLQPIVDAHGFGSHRESTFGFRVLNFAELREWMSDAAEPAA